MKPNKLRLLGTCILGTLTMWVVGTEIGFVCGMLLIFMGLGIAILTPEDEYLENSK